jgi:TonB family protein
MLGPWEQWECLVVNGEFHLRQHLGGADESAVFLTEYGQPQPQKAAIKLISAHATSPEVQLSHWRRAAKLSHPHLIRLFQMGRCELDNAGLVFVVMEYAEEDLAQVFPERPLTPAEARAMLKPTLDALAFLHEKGFVHGRLKPANIMSIGDQIKVSSDGIRRTDESSVGLGTSSAYDPPEAARGQSSAAGDVWSLGVVLVEALTQHPLIWEKTKQDEPGVPEGMPAPFLDIARHCLRRDPRGRWTMAEIAERLEQSSDAPRPETIARSKKAVAKRRRYLVPTIAVVLILGAIIAGSRLSRHRQQEVPRTASAVQEPLRAQPPQKEVPAMPATGRSTQSISDNEQGSRVAASPPAVQREVQSVAGGTTAAVGLVPGEVLQRILPEVPPSARATIQGTIRVRVRVSLDSSGTVTEAEFDSPGPSKYFARLALEAAQAWKFAPPRVDGRTVLSDWNLRFEFTKDATKVFPAQTAP